MSDSKDSGKSDAIHFSWGRKGGQNKEVQFYKSFTYDGVEYSLYDCVYALKEGEGKPYIGKLIKIWELKNKQRKVKLLWFFYPEEISNFLEGESMLENELFLATGVGKGLTNINPLEVIAGKCNVICISKDERNRKPSDEEFKMADHVFYRTFNVQDHTISDKLGEKIAMIDVNFLLNKNDIQSRDLSKVDSRDIFVGLKKDDEGAISLLDKSEAHSMGNVDAAGADKIDPVMLVRNLINKDPGGSDKDEEYRVSEGLLILNDDKGSKEKGDVVTPCNLGSVALPATEVAHASCQSPKLRSLDSEHNDVQDKCVMIPTENGATQNFELCGFVDLMIEKAINYGLQDSGKYNIDDLVPPVNATDDRKSEIMRDSDISTGVVENVKFKARPLKKLKIDDTAPLLSDNVGNNTQNYGTGGSRKALQSVGTAIESNEKGRVTKYCNGTSNGLPKKLKKGFTEDESDLKHIKESVNQSKDEQGTAAAYIAINKASLPDIAIDDAEVAGKVKSNIQDKSNEKLCKVLIKESKGVEAEAFGCVKEVTQRPHDRSKWFTASPWEERMKEAHDQGRLVLLQNLDATYTSSEVEDIVWHGFGESCTAKVVQRTATSNHFSAKALVIFKTREVAEKIVSKLDKECLMLPNSRPLLGSREVCFPGKHSPFPGHLVIDKLRHQKHRESREAVSTSHSSQSHTLEYEMAIEWCLLQHRSELWWNMLHKRQAEDIKKLKACLKSEMI